MSDKATNLKLELMRLGTLKAGSDEAWNFGIWERHESMKIEMKMETRWKVLRIRD